VRVVKCGTPSGYTTHRKRGEPQCEDCQEAHNSYMRAYKKRPGRSTWHYNHGPEIDEWFARVWLEQAGTCYLCTREIDPTQARVDHDHNCCGDQKSCSKCRRGIACNDCNLLIGLARDDPETLRLIADNLEKKHDDGYRSSESR
jgi:hypothetical protein